jgi:hypothetical protein
MTRPEDLDPENRFPRSDLSDEENNKRRMQLTDGGAWKTDATFNALAKGPFNLRKRSYQCAIELACANCDGRIHYKFRKIKSETIDAQTGRRDILFEDYEWNTEFESIMVNGGSQNRGNTPEGSKCECFCHDPKPKRNGSRLVVTPTGGMKELSYEERKKLK